jgi:hypothetical protein
MRILCLLNKRPQRFDWFIQVGRRSHSIPARKAERVRFDDFGDPQSVNPLLNVKRDGCLA